jgi:hypothetical protein
MKKMASAEHVARAAERGAYGVLIGTSEGKMLLGKPRCRWEDNIKKYVK